MLVGNGLEAPRLIRASWAPILFEPIAGSGERLTIALAAIDSDGSYRCLSTIDPATARILFRDEREYVKDLVSLTIESCQAFLATNNHLASWEPPLGGVYVGTIQESEAASLEELIGMAAPMSAFFYSQPMEASQKAPEKRALGWDVQVQDIVLRSNDRFRHNMNVPVFLGNHEAPAIFTFLSPSFAANLVFLSTRGLKQQVEDARAKLWSLDLLSDAPSYLFRPELRELIAGVESDDDPKRGLVKEAIEELTEEARRRSVAVAQVDSPEAAAEHIVSRAMAA